MKNSGGSILENLTGVQFQEVGMLKNPRAVKILGVNLREPRT